MYQHYLVGVLKHRLLGLSSRLSGSAGLEWGLGICISSKSPDDADIVVRGPHFEKLCLNSWCVYVEISFSGYHKGCHLQDFHLGVNHYPFLHLNFPLRILNQQIWFSLFSSFIKMALFLKGLIRLAFFHSSIQCKVKLIHFYCCMILFCMNIPIDRYLACF